MAFKRCVICAKSILDIDLSEGRAYYEGDAACCTDCLRKLAQKPKSLSDARTTVHYCLKCGSKVKPEEVQEGGVLPVSYTHL
ncbi:MAG: hypothetical protein N2234_08800, partial [Planctomycetota bacterium]|nr:hypothetical protein [Planctomycetota bacterium]